jgi:outer membrane protein
MTNLHGRRAVDIGSGDGANLARAEKEPMPNRLTTRIRPRRWLAALSLLGAALVALPPHGAAGWTTPPVPAGPGKTVELPAPPPPALGTSVSVPEDVLKPGATITLSRIVDIALANNPLTRGSYLQARSAAATLGSKRAPYYPSVALAASGTRTNTITQDPTLPGTEDVTTVAADVSYLLLDLGGRAANADDARFGLVAADWSHNATVANVILDVETTYVAYLNAKAQLEAAQANVKTAEAALDAANKRHDAGVATIAEVLQARTALSQAQLSQQSFGGDVLALRGALATAMGLPANTPYDIGTLPTEVPLERTTEAVDTLIATARQRRPDLVAARALVDKSGAHIRAVRSDGLPALGLAASVGKTYYRPDITTTHKTDWSASLLVTVPLFSGFGNSYDIAKATADAAVAQAQADTLDQQVVLQVWTSYYAFATATQLVKTSRDLLASAEQSERVALGRYREGVGTIIDLLTAQAALASARAQEIQARAGWFAATAQLAHDTGTAAPLDQTITVTKEGNAP